MKTNLIIRFFIFLTGASASGQDITFPSLEGFKKITEYPVYTRGNLRDFIDGAADTYLALGFVNLQVAEYKKGKEVIKLEIYRLADHTMAFGIYASERSPSFRFVNLGSQGYITEGIINFFKGPYYVKIRTYSDKPKILSAEESLAARVADMLNGETEMPGPLAQFPEAGRKQNEETYINESVLGHKFLNKAFKAVYESGSDNFSIYLIKSGSGNNALSAVQSYLKDAGIEPDQQESGKYAFTDGHNGTIFLSWKDDRIVIISGLAKDQADIAEQYTSGILK